MRHFARRKSDWRGESGGRAVALRLGVYGFGTGGGLMGHAGDCGCLASRNSPFADFLNSIGLDAKEAVFDPELGLGPRSRTESRGNHVSQEIHLL